LLVFLLLRCCAAPTDDDDDDDDDDDAKKAADANKTAKAARRLLLLQLTREQGCGQLPTMQRRLAGAAGVLTTNDVLVVVTTPGASHLTGSRLESCGWVANA
jgi:hypothetical protein